MKANGLTSRDLMIGDWLMHANGTPMQVKRIVFGHFACGEKYTNFWEYNNIFQPIPLTPEILEKNGFEGIKGGRFPTLKNCYGDILFQLEDIKNEYIRDTLYMFKNIPIFYVHELQNALRLCRIEKEIVV